MIAGSGFLETSPVGALFVPTEQVTIRLVKPTNRTWPKRFIAVVLTGITVLAPYPVASNHPLIWLVWAFVIGVSGTIFHLFAPPRKRQLCQPVSAMIGLTALFIGFAVWQGSALPFLTSTTPRASLLAAVRLASYLAFFVLMLRVAGNRRISNQILQLLFYSIALHGLLAMLMLQQPFDAGGLLSNPAYPGAATGFFVNKNAFATFLGMGLVLGVTQLQSTRGKLHGDAVEWMRRAALGLALLITLIALINTQSRMGMTASFIGVVTVAVINAVNRKTMFAGIVATGLVLLIYGQSLLERFSTVAQSGVTRLDLYQQVGAMIRERPFTGFGLDSFPLAFQQFHAPPVSAGFVWDKAHSTYLTLWAESGIFAGSLPLIIAVLAFFALWTRVQKQRRGVQPVVAAIGALALCAVHSLVDFSLEIQANMFVLLTIIAIGLARPPRHKGF